MDANSGFKQTYGIHFDYDILYSIGVKEKELTNKKCFRNIYAPLGGKFKITTYIYKAWV